MTVKEKTRLLEEEFSVLWKKLWNNENEKEKYSNEYIESYDKMEILKQGVVLNDETYNLSDLISESNKRFMWKEPKWGIPKGRRNINENVIECALREFSEETGYDNKELTFIDNLLPFEEIFSGSNYKSSTMVKVD